MTMANASKPNAHKQWAARRTPELLRHVALARCTGPVTMRSGCGKSAKPLVLSALLILCGIHTGVTQAGVRHVSVSPSSVTIAPNNVSVLHLQWHVRLDRSSDGEIRSTTGRFVSPANGRVLGRRLQLLQKRAANAVLSPYIAERVTIPPEVLTTAATENLQRIVYEREFTDGAGRARGQVSITLLRPPANTLRLKRVVVSFPGAATQVRAKLDEPLHARLTLAPQGVGRLAGRWLVARLNATQAPLRFQEIHSVSLNLSGSDVVELKSPKLPSAQLGVYVLKFVIDHPETAIEVPVVQYTIVD
jgi:hypothetical protein